MNLREPSFEALVTTVIFSFSIPSQTIVSGVPASSADSHSSHTIIHWSSQQSHRCAQLLHLCSAGPLARSGIKSSIESGSPLEYPDTISCWRIRVIQCWHQYSEKAPFIHGMEVSCPVIGRTSHFHFPCCLAVVSSDGWRSPLLQPRQKHAGTEWGPQLQTKVREDFTNNHGEGPYYGLLLDKSVY